MITSNWNVDLEEIDQLENTADLQPKAGLNVRSKSLRTI